MSLEASNPKMIDKNVALNEKNSHLLEVWFNFLHNCEFQRFWQTLEENTKLKMIKNTIVGKFTTKLCLLSVGYHFLKLNTNFKKKNISICSTI